MGAVAAAESPQNVSVEKNMDAFLDDGVTEEKLLAEKNPPVETKQEPEVEQVDQEASQDPDQEFTQARKSNNPWAELRRTKRELEAERKAREQTEQRIQVLEQRVAPVFEQQHQQQQPQQVSQAPEIPEYTEDPLGHLQARLDRSEKANAALAMQTIANSLQARMANEELAYEKINPEYPAAREYALRKEMLRLKALGANDQQVLGILAQRRDELAQSAWSQGMNIGEALYKYAEADGFVPQQKQVESQAKERLEAVKLKEQLAHSSLGNIPSTPTQSEKVLTKKSIQNMTEKEMDEWDARDPGWMDKILDQ